MARERRDATRLVVMGFGWTPWDFRPGLIDAANLDPHPIVLLFLHVPKCGGTSVRSIFRAGWHRTHWSLSNRPAGVWHSHRMLKAIHDALKQNKTRIFAEWHIELNFTFLPEFERQADFIHHELKEQGILKTVAVDAAQLDFIDSAGLGFLIALKKVTQDEGVSMSISNLPPRPRKTFEIARVDKVLLHA